MRNLIKNKKKKGFTLIEMVAVVAIIGILAAVLVPKITGYINEAKKTEVIKQVRDVAQAYETLKMKQTDPTTDPTSVPKGTAIGNITDATMLSILNVTTADELTKDNGSLNKLPSGITIEQCIDITDRTSDFLIDSQTGKLTHVGTTEVGAVKPSPAPPAS